MKMRVKMNEIGSAPIMTGQPVALLMVLPCSNAMEVSAGRVSRTALAVVSHDDVLEIFVTLALVWFVFSK